MKALYPTCDVTIGTTVYHVHLRIQPARDSAHVGADSPSYMKPGSPRRVSIIRILKGGEDCSDMFWATRKAIEKEVTRLAARGLLSPGAVKGFASTGAAPSFENTGESADRTGLSGANRSAATRPSPSQSSRGDSPLFSDAEELR